MGQTLIQKYVSSIVRGLIERINSLSKLNHRLTKGELRELFVSNLLNSFLTNQFDVGSGIIVNQKGEQSAQTDIIVYDKRVLPPFIKEQHIGIYPAECVLATIEIKSYLSKTDLLKAENSARQLLSVIYDAKSSIYKNYNQFKPICAVLGFYGNGARELSDIAMGKSWLNRNVRNVISVGLLDKYSWINMDETGWTCHPGDASNDETKRFIAVLLDNIRTQAERRFKILSGGHYDLIGVYIRDQNLFG